MYKYLKYKQQYLNFKKIIGGFSLNEECSFNIKDGYNPNYIL